MIRPHVTVQQSSVYLRDMLEDTAGVPEEWLNRAVVKVTSVQPQEYDLTAIAYILQRFGDMNNASLSGSGKIIINRAKRLVQDEELKNAVRNYVVQERGDNDDYRIDFQKIRRKVWVPSGDAEVEVRPSRTGNTDRSVRTFIAELYVEDEKVCSIPISASIVELHEVWVARDRLPQGHVVKNEDLVVRKMELTDRGRRRVPVGDNIVGQELSRTVQRDTPILTHVLRSPLCARKGDYITVVATSGNMRIALKATALSTGRLGERILCKNQRSNRQFLVELTGVNKAKLARL